MLRDGVGYIAFPLFRGLAVHASEIGAAMAVTLSSTLPGPAAQALAVGTAALVVFGVIAG